MDVRIPKEKRTAFQYLNPFRKVLVKYALIASDTDPGKKYAVSKRVNLFGAAYACSCWDHYFRQHECKHIRRFKEQLSQEV
jgi:hypothetical protein